MAPARAEEAAADDTDLVFTLVWALDLPEDTAGIRTHLAPFVEAGRRIAMVELYADLDTRLDRNRTPYRLAEKKSKRDLEWSDDNVRGLERIQMNTDTPSPADALIAEHPHLRIDNTDRAPEDVAAEILAVAGDPGRSATDEPREPATAGRGPLLLGVPAVAPDARRHHRLRPGRRAGRRPDQVVPPQTRQRTGRHIGISLSLGIRVGYRSFGQ